jgi:hypothetical protein
VTHAEALARDAADAYVRAQLNPADREAFEEHYFSCDECFAEVQAADALRRAVRASARTGVPPATASSRTSALWALPLAASVLLAAGLGWVLFVERPSLRSRIATLSAERDALSAPQPAPPPEAAPPIARAEANVPLVLLEAERGSASTARLAVPASATLIVVAIAAPAGATRLEVNDEANRSIVGVDGLARNASGIYVVTLPVGQMPAGRYRLRLTDGATRQLIGEYILELSRP